MVLFHEVLVKVSHIAWMAEGLEVDSSTHLSSDMELDSTEVPCCGTSSVVTLSSQKEQCKSGPSRDKKSKLP